MLLTLFSSRQRNLKQKHQPWMALTLAKKTSGYKAGCE